MAKVLVFQGITEKDLLKAMTLIPFGEIQYPLGIEWTLVFEVFYISFMEYSLTKL